MADLQDYVKYAYTCSSSTKKPLIFNLNFHLVGGNF